MEDSKQDREAVATFGFPQLPTELVSQVDSRVPGAFGPGAPAGIWARTGNEMVASLAYSLRS